MKKQKKQNKRPQWAGTTMSPKARAYYQNSFLPRYNDLLKEIAETPLAILVWGPGPSGADLYNKRLQIRDQLRSLGHAAQFSEEIDSSNAQGLSAKVIEICQAIAADFIVVIQASPGSIAETHDFAEFVDVIGRKMLIFIDEQAQAGYSYTGALQELQSLYKNVETYKYPQDIHECHLTRSVRKKVQTLQAVKWRSQLK